MSSVRAPHVAVIIVAAGAGSRLDAGAPKALVALDRDTVLRHAVRAACAAGPAQIVVVAPPGRVNDARADAHAEAGGPHGLVEVVPGGDTRQDSVAAGLAALRRDVDTVLVHDAARALTPADVYARVISAVMHGADAVVPVLPVVDTLKHVDGDRVVGTADRDALAAAQTPQGFRRGVLESAYRAADRAFTDDAALVAAAGHPVRTVPGDPLSFKITTGADLVRARSLVAEASPAPRPPRGDARVGIGTDAHAFGGEGMLWLAGLAWPGEPGLSGHSDGDVAAHAIVDALLSAAGLGDIGTHFGTARPEYADAHADVFLARTRALLADAGYAVGNVSVQVQASRPKLASRRAEAEAVLSGALGGASVSVAATTTDGLGFPGRAEGVAAYAVALVVPR